MTRKNIYMAIGTVKWFNSQKGFGFIQPEDGSKDVFVHMSALVAARIPYLDDGTRVSFDLEESTGKRAAANLGLLTAGPAEAVAAS